MRVSSGPEQVEKFLSRFPEHCRPIISEYLQKYKCSIRITKPRKYRLGSFRAATGRQLPLITINGDLGLYTFLLVFLHELAHYEVWLNFRRRVQPHGNEWKNAFRELTGPVMQEGILPDELISGLLKYFLRTHATFQKDTYLLNILIGLEGNQSFLTLNDIAENSPFLLHDGRLMIKQAKLRTRYKCYCPATRRYYLVPGAIQILPAQATA